MTPMTPEQRGDTAFFLWPAQNPAAPELVRSVAVRARVLEEAAGDREALVKFTRDTTAVVRRLLDAERDIEALRRILATAITVADDNPDYGLTAGELLHLLTGSGLDLTQDIADAEQLRDAEQLAGAR